MLSQEVITQQGRQKITFWRIGDSLEEKPLFFLKKDEQIKNSIFILVLLKYFGSYVSREQVGVRDRTGYL